MNEEIIKKLLRDETEDNDRAGAREELEGGISNFDRDPKIRCSTRAKVEVERFEAPDFCK